MPVIPRLAADIDTIAASTVRIHCTDNRGRARSGTGYVVAAGIVATCDHVVRDLLEGEPITLRFDDNIETTATCLERDPHLDSALLAFEPADPDRLVPAIALGGERTSGRVFAGWGFSTYAKGEGLSLSGVVGRIEAKDDLGQPAIELDCPQASAGNATPMHGFSGSPVVVDGLVIGHIRRFLSDPADERRAAFGKLYATPSSSVHALLTRIGSAFPAGALPEVTTPTAGSDAARADIDKLKTMLDASKAERTVKEAFELRAAESLIQLAAPADALQALNALPPSSQRDRLRALALAKIGTRSDLDEAFRILQTLRDAGERDPETAGILGGRYKDLWRLSGENEHLQLSHDTYLEAFEADPQAHYPGINSAATALWLGHVDLSRHLARRVLDVIEATPKSARDCWHIATEAEAALLLGEQERARALYNKACERCDYAPHTVHTIERQLNHHEHVLGHSRTTLPRS